MTEDEEDEEESQEEADGRQERREAREDDYGFPGTTAAFSTFPSYFLLFVPVFLWLTDYSQYFRAYHELTTSLFSPICVKND